VFTVHADMRAQRVGLFGATAFCRCDRDKSCCGFVCIVAAAQILPQTPLEHKEFCGKSTLNNFALNRADQLSRLFVHLVLRFEKCPAPLVTL